LTPKVLIGVPSYTGHAYCRKQLVESLKRIAQPENIDVLIVWNGPKLWGFDDFTTKIYKQKPGDRGVDILREKQNIIRDYAIKHKYDYIFLLESDNIPPDNIIDKLLSHNKDIITGFYFLKTTHSFNHPCDADMKRKIKRAIGIEPDVAVIVRQTPVPHIMQLYRGTIFEPDKAARMWTMDDWVQAKQRSETVVPIYAAGVGALLISREVFEQVRFTGGLGEFKDQLTDIVFYRDAGEFGYTPWCDLDCIVDHLHLDPTYMKQNKWFDKDTLKDL